MTPAAPPNAVVRFVQALAPAPGGPDGDLLARYLDTRDEAAFAELVRRHGGMVVAVCRRVLADPADADDAAQAAFLVLVRRAHSFTRHATVGDFLHGVALRTALKLRARRARRRVVEAAAARPEVTPPAPDHDVREQVDRAVRALPAKLRDAVVLCELEGVPRLEAAARLNVPPGTLASRLAAARVKLVRRLGPVAPALLAALPAESARAAGVIVPVVTGAIPAAVTVLATEVTRMLVFHKLKVLLAGAAVAAGATGAGVALTRPAAADDPKPPAKAADKPDAAAPAPVRPTPPAGKPAATSVPPEMARRLMTGDAYARLAGEWAVRAMFVDGKPTEVGSGSQPVALNFRHDRPDQWSYTVRVSSITTQFVGDESVGDLEMSYVLNPHRAPREMTLISGFRDVVRPRLVGYIYEFAGDRLRLAGYQLRPYETDRPRGFASADQPPGSPPLVVLELERKPLPRPATDAQTRKAVKDARAAADAAAIRLEQTLKTAPAPNTPAVLADREAAMRALDALHEAEKALLRQEIEERVKRPRPAPATPPAPK